MLPGRYGPKFILMSANFRYFLTPLQHSRSLSILSLPLPSSHCGRGRHIIIVPSRYAVILQPPSAPLRSIRYLSSLLLFISLVQCVNAEHSITIPIAVQIEHAFACVWLGPLKHIGILQATLMRIEMMFGQPHESCGILLTEGERAADNELVGSPPISF